MCFLSRGADLVRTPFFTLPPKAKGALLEKPSKNTRYRNWEGPIIFISCKDFPSIPHNKNRAYALLYSYA